MHCCYALHSASRSTTSLLKLYCSALERSGPLQRLKTTGEMRLKWLKKLMRLKRLRRGR
jgi:hypothetical protein